MSIRVKLILTYAILVVISASVLIFSGIAVVTKVITEVGESVLEEVNIPVVVSDIVDILAELKQAEDYEPKKLISPDFIKELTEKTDFYNGGLLVKYDNEFYNYSNIPSDDDFYIQLKELNGGYEKKQPGKEHLIEYEDKHYFYIDYSFEVDGKEVIYFFVVNASKPDLIRTRSGHEFLSVLLIILVIITLPLLIIITKDIIKPIRELERGVKYIKEGNLDFKLETESKNEIGRVITYFDVMRSELKKSIDKQIQVEENRKELISSISHDLKTPVTSIKGHVEGIRDGVANTPEKLDKYLEVIYQKSIDMDQLIDDLFLFSKLDLSKLPFEMRDVEVTPFLNELISEMKLGWENENNHINLNSNSEDLRFTIDQQQIKRVFVNIIQNSMKYIDKTEKTIDITVSDNDEYVQIVIADNGTGIDDEHLNRIFDRFYRVDESRSLETGGTGLGLAIAKQIVEQHGGHIFATSKVGKGTKIVIELKKM